MQAAIRRYTDEVRRTHGVEVQIRVGLNSGEVVVRSIGNDLHMDYSAIGQTTHLAARMEQLAAPGSIRLTADTLGLAEGFIQVTSLGPIPVRGLPEPVEVFELIGAAPVRTRMQAAVARGLTRFVGRQTELEALSQALGRAGRGRGEVVALVGEPGVGKSRLVWEFTHSHRTDGWLALESGSVSYGKATAYRPVIDLLKTYFQIEDRDDARKIREKVTGKLLTLDRALEPTLPAFLALLDVPIEDPEWQALDPPLRRRRTLEACKRLVLRESQVQPLLLLFEDLHWIDTETQAFLDSLIESLPTARLLLLVNYRPEYQQTWASRMCYSQLRIDSLPPESAEELLEALLGAASSLRPLKQLLIQRTDGNPFFLEESVRTLVETQILSGERGSYRLATTVDSIRVPATVQAVLAARIDRLPPDEKRLLQTAAVIGKDVLFALIKPISDLPELELRQGLTRLQAGEFLYETSLFPDLEYTFKHALTHEVAYASVLQDRRRALHAQIVAAIEALYQDRLPEQVDRLAYHAVRGEDWEKALVYLRQAGAKAAGRSAQREAVAYFEQALTVVPHLPESRQLTEQAVDLRLTLRNSLLPLGEFGRTVGYLREAEKLAAVLDDPRRLGWVSAYLAPSLHNMGDYGNALQAGQRGLAISLAVADSALEVMASFFVSLAHIHLGNYREATAYLRRNVEALEGDLARERFGEPGLPYVFNRAYLAWCLAECGEFAEGIARAEEAVAMAEAEAVDQPFTTTHAYFGLGLLYLRMGEWAKAISMLERCVHICETADVPMMFAYTAHFLGSAYALSGRVADGLALLERAAAQAASIGIVALHSLRIAHLGEAYLLTGQIEKAMASATQAADLARDHDERGSAAWTLRLLGEIHSHRDPPEVTVAEDSYLQAEALAAELGMRPLVAHCHLGLGRLYQRTAKREQAHEHLTTAMMMYREMDMRYWLEQAEVEMRELGQMAAG